MNDLEPIAEAMTEGAKAVQSVAKFGVKGLETVEKFGGFVAKYIDGPLTLGKQIAEDHLRYVRWEREQRLMLRAQAFMQQAKLDHPTRPIPLNIAVPLFQAATLEENDDLQDIWAALLVNGANEESGVFLRRTHIDILERLSPLDARVLSAIYSVDVPAPHVGILTAGLPERAVANNTPPGIDSESPEPSEEVQLSLSNLARLGCVSLGTTWKGNQIFRDVFHTVLGKDFIRACTLLTK